MKKLKYSRFVTAVLLVLFTFSISNCSVRVGGKPKVVHAKSKPLPPGQAKKIYGGKSAKRYAPGHNKNS